MRAMHYAVDHLNMATIFPMSDGSVTTDNPSALKKCLDELKGSELNKAQQDAITSMLDPACRQVHVCVCMYVEPIYCTYTEYNAVHLHTCTCIVL